VIFVTVFIANFVLLAACSMSPSAVTQTYAPSAVWSDTVGLADVQDGAGALISTAAEPAAPQETPINDGTALLERHCAKCHLVQRLQQIKKPPSEWEKTLTQMETMGVHLEDAEKVDLLEYLTAADKP
jgi:mono/diheme cytochrome c family protein